jgi:hypothetical protein
MKAQIISILLFFSALTPLVAGNTQQCYFCTNKGAVLEYERRTPESGIVWKLESTEELVSARL